MSVATAGQTARRGQTADVSRTEQWGFMLAAFLHGLGARLKDLLPASWAPDVDRAVDLLSPVDDRGQVSGFMVMIIGGSALIVGFFVVATINSALPSIENSSLANDKDTTLDRIGQALVLGGVVLIVIGVTMVLRTLRSV